MSPRLAQSHTPTPDVNGICLVCGWECVSLKADPESPEPQPGDLLSEDQLNAMHPGKRAYDVDGDVWVKQTDGKWRWHVATLDNAAFAYIFRPKLAEDA